MEVSTQETKKNLLFLVLPVPFIFLERMATFKQLVTLLFPCKFSLLILLLLKMSVTGFFGVSVWISPLYLSSFPFSKAPKMIPSICAHRNNCFRLFCDLHKASCQHLNWGAIKTRPYDHSSSLFGTNLEWEKSDIG